MRACQAALEALPDEQPVGAAGAAAGEAVGAVSLEVALEVAMAGAVVRAREKLDVVFSCQHYGEARREGAPQAADVDLLLRLLPGLKVAYLERRSAVEVAVEGGSSDGGSGAAARGDSGAAASSDSGAGAGRDNGAGASGDSGAAAGSGTDQYAAVLVGSDGAGGLHELGRVALPGMPILGEGKPENQSLGLTFTRGAKLMVVDMNQARALHEPRMSIARAWRVHRVRIACTSRVPCTSMR